MKNNNKTRIKDLIEKGAREGVFPGAVLLVAKKDEIVFQEAVGYRSLVPERHPMDESTIFDLASLTKPLATTLALMKLVDTDKLELDQPLATILPEPLSDDKRAITTRLLLCHAAGFVDWKPFYLDLMAYDIEKRKGLLRNRILQEPLACAPGDQVLYSDLGFMILERVIEEASGTTLPRYLERHYYRLLSLKRTFFIEGNRQERYALNDFAPTEECPWRKKIIIGEVHDENASALGGYAGHAGLFGTVEEVYEIVRLLREHYLGLRQDYLSPETVKTFFTRQERVEESTWALGWDTPSLEGSSSGRFFSKNSVGHLGFTGTSIWMDLEKDVVVILLTNRIHPTRDNERIKAFRPKLHDTVMKALFH